MTRPLLSHPKLQISWRIMVCRILALLEGGVASVIHSNQTLPLTHPSQYQDLPQTGFPLEGAALGVQLMVTLMSMSLVEDST